MMTTQTRGRVSSLRTLQVAYVIEESESCDGECRECLDVEALVVGSKGTLLRVGGDCGGEDFSEIATPFMACSSVERCLGRATVVSIFALQYYVLSIPWASNNSVEAQIHTPIKSYDGCSRKWVEAPFDLGAQSFLSTTSIASSAEHSRVSFSYWKGQFLTVVRYMRGNQTVNNASLPI